MSRLPALGAVTMAVILAFTSADPLRSEDGEGVDIKVAARQLVSDIRRMAIQAKSGKALDALRADVLHLQTTASDLIGELPGEVSECDVQFTIKMAATRAGSHEILTVLLADDMLSVLNGRLSLSLEFLEQVAQLMEDELSLAADVGPHLTAIVFGTNVTLDITDTADKTVKAVVAQTASDDDVNGKGRVRRQVKTHFDLGGGWSLGLRGVQWDSSDGLYTFNARPTFSGFRPDGFWATFTMRF